MGHVLHHRGSYDQVPFDDKVQVLWKHQWWLLQQIFLFWEHFVQFWIYIILTPLWHRSFWRSPHWNKRNTSKNINFYLIVIGTLSAVSCLSAITIAVKKYQAYQSDKNLVKNINIMIINERGEPIEQFNTQKYNKPIMNIVMNAALIFLGVGSFLTSIVFFNVNDSTSDYVKRFWYKWARNIFFRTILPILIITFYHKDFQRFLLKTCHDMWSNVHLQNNRIHPILPQ